MSADCMEAALAMKYDRLFCVCFTNTCKNRGEKNYTELLGMHFGRDILEAGRLMFEPVFILSRGYAYRVCVCVF